MLRDQVRLAGADAELNSLSEQLANTYEELSLIYQISSGMRVNRRAADFFKQTCLDVLEVMNVGAMGVALDGQNAALPEPVVYGRLVLPPVVVHRLGAELLPSLRQRKAPLLVNQLAGDKQFHWLAGHARQLLAVPLQRQEQVLGCLFLLDKQSGEFDSVDSKLLNSIANESAIYLENSMLFADVHGLMMGLLHSLTSAVDAKDAYTCGHSERVALLSRHVAQEVALPDVEVEQVYMAGLLHDVGKIGVPESVLQKTGKLTNEEFEQMKKHPQIGARILADVKQIKSMRAMQAIQPKMKAIQERYKNDRQRQSEEMMKLYKESGTNPLSSCLPILVQSPFFMSLYGVLSNIAKGHEVGVIHASLLASAQRAHIFGAPLSVKFMDSASKIASLGASAVTVRTVTIVMIVLMSASQFYTQRQLMTKNVDMSVKTPFMQQQKMLMYVFPLIFAVFGLFLPGFPVGVLIYWLTTNAWTMGQQLVVIRRNPTPGSVAYKERMARLKAKGKIAPDGTPVKTSITSLVKGGTAAKAPEQPVQEAAAAQARRQQPKRQTKAQRQAAGHVTSTSGPQSKKKS